MSDWTPDQVDEIREALSHEDDVMGGSLAAVFNAILDAAERAPDAPEATP